MGMAEQNMDNFANRHGAKGKTNTENINGKLYVEESYPITDIGGGVISKGQAIRHFEKEHPEYTVVAISSFKIDHQTETIKVRVQVKPKMAKLEKHIFLPDENAKPVDPVALLNPGYDELKLRYDTLKDVSDRHSRQMESAYNELEEKYDSLVIAHGQLFADYEETKKSFDAIVEAAAKDAQKFSDLLVENEELTAANKRLVEENNMLDRAVAGYVREKLTEKQEVKLSPEDAADLADATPDEKERFRNREQDEDGDEQVGNRGLGESQGEKRKDDAYNLSDN